MPVIGRLDRQVEDLIISPISQRRRDEDPAADAGEQPAAQSPPRDAPPAPNQTPHPNESSAEADELPVWLL